MIEGKFDVVFRGQVVKNIELTQVKNNLVKLFKSSPEAVERLFGGKEVTIRKGLDYASAMKYQSALKAAGALALIKELNDQTEKEAQVKTGQSSSVTQSKPEVKVQAAEKVSSTSATVASIPEEPVNPEEVSIAAVGAQILPPKVYQQREVDTSEYSLAEAGERILPEKAPEEFPQPSIDHLSLE